MNSKKKFPRKVLKSISQMFSGNVVMTIGGFISGYFYALYLGPEYYGTWQTANVILSYTFIFSLSLPFILRRDYIFLRKEGRMDEAQKMSDITFTYSVVVGVLVAIGIFLYAFFAPENIVFKYGLYTISIIYLFNIFIGFGNIMSKGVNKYGYITWQKSIHTCGLLITVPFVYWYGYNALLIGFALTNLADALFFIIKQPVKLGFYWNTKLFKKMVFNAFPLYLAAVSTIIFASVDRLLIASILSFKDVGLYSLSNLIANPISLLVSSTSIVLFTELNEKYGSKTDSNIIRKHVIFPQEIFSKLLPPLMGMGLIALPLAVRFFLPKYENGIEAAQINIFAIYFFTMTGFSSNALFILNKQKLSALTFLMSGIIKVSISLLLIKLELGITGVAIGSVIAYLFYDLIMLKIIFNNINENIKSYIKHFIKTIIPILFILGYVLLLRYYNNQLLLIFVEDWLLLIFSEILLFIISIPLFLSVYKTIKSYL